MAEPLQSIWRLMLAELTIDRADVGAAMAFALASSPAAAPTVRRDGRGASVSQLVEALLERAAARDLSYPNRLALLYLISDVLHASLSVGGARHFYSLLEQRLAEVIRAFSLFLQTVQGRLRVESVKRDVLGVLAAWEEAGTFSPIYTATLQNILLEPPENAQSAPLQHDPLDGAPWQPLLENHESLLDPQLDGEKLDQPYLRRKLGLGLELEPDAGLELEPGLGSDSEAARRVDKEPFI